MKLKDLQPKFQGQPPMAKKKVATKKKRKATPAEAKADGVIAVKFHTDAGLNGRMFSPDKGVYQLTPAEYDSMHRSCTIVEEVEE